MDIYYGKYQIDILIRCFVRAFEVVVSEKKWRGKFVNPFINCIFAT